jgi:DNA-directed RNA polymerase specialized sigma24 family protein
MRQEQPATAPTLAEAYERLRPVLFGVLRRLVRQGYVASVGQGLDFVHDFFVEAWPGITERFDPAQGSLEAYVAGAFARFVRPRLVREARWAAALEVDPVGWGGPIAESDPARAIDIARVRQALAALDASDRTLLLARFGQVPISERVLAARLSTTRHRVREQLALALARLAVVLGERGVLPEPDFRVARLLFIDECSIPAAAARLSLTEPQVRAARRRLLTALGRASVEVAS